MALAADSRNYKGSGTGEVAGIYRLHTHLWPSLMILEIFFLNKNFCSDNYYLFKVVNVKRNHNNGGGECH